MYGILTIRECIANTIHCTLDCRDAPCVPVRDPDRPRRPDRPSRRAAPARIWRPPTALHVRVAGPRRYGKTSLLLAHAAEPRRTRAGAPCTSTSTASRRWPRCARGSPRRTRGCATAGSARTSTRSAPARPLADHVGHRRSRSARGSSVPSPEATSDRRGRAARPAAAAVRARPQPDAGRVRRVPGPAQRGRDARRAAALARAVPRRRRRPTSTPARSRR